MNHQAVADSCYSEAKYSEAKIGPNHRLCGVSKVVGGLKCLRQLRRLIYISSVLETEPEMRNQRPVDAGTVDEKCLGLCAGTYVGRSLLAERVDCSANLRCGRHCA